MHLVDTSMFFAPEGGGVGRYLAEKHVWLGRNTRWRHTIVAPGPQTVTEQGRSIYRAPLRVRHGFTFPLTRACWTRRIVAAAPDLIESGDPYLLAWSSLDAAQRLGVPAIGFYHSDVVGTSALRFGRPGESMAQRYARALYRQFDLVLAPSQYVAARLRALGIERVACQPLGVDVRLFHPLRRDHALRERLGLPRHARLAVFAGRFAREKNLEVLFAAIAQLGAPYHLVLVGSGHAPPAPANVTVLAYQRDAATLARIVASADVFVHAGDRETFGLVVLEAMASALPVVAVGGGAIDELVAHHGVLVGRRGPVALAEAIRSVFDEDTAAMGFRARAWVERNYTWDAVLRNLVALYARVHAAGREERAQALVAP